MPAGIAAAKKTKSQNIPIIESSNIGSFSREALCYIVQLGFGSANDQDSNGSTDACLSLGVPNVAIITGEGMSGGAIAITTANRVLMFEHAIYSVISPEAASSILWRDGTKAQEAATSMKITAQDMLRFGVIDSILREPSGGAHRDPNTMIAATGDAIEQALNDLRNLDPDTIRKQRRQKFLDIGRKLG